MGASGNSRVALDQAALHDATNTATEISVIAAADPDRPAIITADAVVRFSELDGRIDQLCQALRRAGIGAGDGLALVSRNRVEWVETFFACSRSGIVLTPVNWHLEAADIAYIVRDCGAKALVGEHYFADMLAPLGAECAVALAVGGAIEGFVDYGDALAAEPVEPIADQTLGSVMIYTSGTTGRPKGVRQPTATGESRRAAAGITALFGFDAEAGDTMLCPAPLYHSGPSRICCDWPLSAGLGVVLMDRFDAATALSLIEEHSVTHAFFVPTMFHRLLALDEAVRAKADVSSLKFVLHGAAPCTVAAKQQMMDWFGPIIHEMFASTEGFGTWVTPDEWLAHPGTVGKTDPSRIKIRTDDGDDAAPDVEGTVWLAATAGGGGAGFEYHGDADKTASAHDDSGGWFTVGDRGRIDADNYLFLTGRSAEVIIVGGVNLYPARIDEALLDHPGVGDVAVVGIPHDELGEQVCAAVVPTDASVLTDENAADELRAALIAHCRNEVGSQMTPAQVDFVASLPRSDAGKLYRQRVRAGYWPSADEGADS